MKTLLVKCPSVQWQPSGLTVHTKKWFLGAGFLVAPAISLKKGSSCVSPLPFDHNYYYHYTSVTITVTICITITISLIVPPARAAAAAAAAAAAKGRKGGVACDSGSPDPAA